LIAKVVEESGQLMQLIARVVEEGGQLMRLLKWTIHGIECKDCGSDGIDCWKDC
jgi:hypothetical protein